MLAFHNDPSVKEKYLSRVRLHKLADEIVKGQYWENGKGCAVGCTIHGSNHSDYEAELGISRILAYLEDTIFEKLPNDRAKEWPEEFLSVINVGADLSNVWPKFAIWLLTDEKYGVLQYAKSEKSKSAILLVANYYKKHKEVTYQEWRAAAYDAAAYAAYAAYDAAAYAAAYTATYAAYAADAATYAATYATYDAIAQADKLLELLRECK